MESSGNTPPTPPYSVPPPAGAGAAAIPTPNPNPSGGAAASAATRTAKALFVPPRANPGASLPPTAPKIKKTTSRRPAEAPAGAPNAKAPRVGGGRHPPTLQRLPQPGRFGGMGGFEGYGAPFGGMGGYGGMGLGSMGGMSGQSAMGGMGGMRGQSAMGGMGAQPGEFMASLMDPSPSTNDDSTGNTIVQDSYEDAQHGGGDGMNNVDK